MTSSRFLCLVCVRMAAVGRGPAGPGRNLHVPRCQRRQGAHQQRRHLRADQDLSWSGAPRIGRPGRRPAASTTAYDGIIEQAAADYDVRAGPGPGGHPGGVGIQPARALAQGRHGPDAADAGDGGRARRAQPVQPHREHPRRRGVSPVAARPLPGRDAGAGGLQRGPDAVDKYGNTVPPYRETQQYVDRVQNITAAEPARRGGKTIYKTLVMVDGQLVPRYSDTKPVIRPLRNRAPLAHSPPHTAGSRARPRKRGHAPRACAPTSSLRSEQGTVKE